MLRYYVDGRQKCITLAPKNDLYRSWAPLRVLLERLRAGILRLPSKYAPYDGNALGRLAHAYALSGDTAKAKTAYQDFRTLWKNADPDIPILKEAKAEYAKLQ
jgi:DNA-binding SARP family transcriptional activator